MFWVVQAFCYDKSRGVKGIREMVPSITSCGHTRHHNASHTHTHGYESKYKVWIQAPDPHTIHTPRSIPWSIPHDTAWSIPLMHTLDPYPWSVPLSRWRKIDAGPNAAFYPNTASGPRTATPVATTVVSTAASAAWAASVLLLLLLLPPLLVIFLSGAAAPAFASAAAPAGPAPLLVLIHFLRVLLVVGQTQLVD